MQWQPGPMGPWGHGEQQWGTGYRHRDGGWWGREERHEEPEWAEREEREERERGAPEWFRFEQRHPDGLGWFEGERAYHEGPMWLHHGRPEGQREPADGPFEGGWPRFSERPEWFLSEGQQRPHEGKKVEFKKTEPGKSVIMIREGGEKGGVEARLTALERQLSALERQQAETLMLLRAKTPEYQQLLEHRKGKRGHHEEDED